MLLAEKLTDSNGGIWSQHLLLFLWGYVPYMCDLSEAAWMGGISSQQFSACSSVFFLLSRVLSVLTVSLKFMFSAHFHQDSLLLCTKVFSENIRTNL